MSIPKKRLALTAVNFSASIPELIAFAHACLWSPVQSTLENALKLGYIAPNAIPGLTLEGFRRHRPFSEATIKGHMDNARKNLKSTQEAKRQEEATQEKADDDAAQQFFEDSFPDQSPKGERTNLCVVSLMRVSGQIHSDLTGRFPIPSSNGYHYILIIYDYDSNSILMEPVKSRKAAELLRAYKKLHARLVKGGCRPKLQRLDNECSAEMK